MSLIFYNQHTTNKIHVIAYLFKFTSNFCSLNFELCIEHIKTNLFLNLKFKKKLKFRL